MNSRESIVFRHRSLLSANQTMDFLKDDVEKNGGSASEVIDIHGDLTLITVCQVPWGSLTISERLNNRLEALAIIFGGE